MSTMGKELCSVNVPARDSRYTEFAGPNGSIFTRIGGTESRKILVKKGG